MTSITVAGIKIPSTDPAFLAIVAVHVLFGLACTIGPDEIIGLKQSIRGMR